MLKFLQILSAIAFAAALPLRAATVVTADGVEIDMDRSKVRVMVSMFGRETPVELELDQVEPVS